MSAIKWDLRSPASNQLMIKEILSGEMGTDADAELRLEMRGKSLAEANGFSGE